MQWLHDSEWPLRFNCYQILCTIMAFAVQLPSDTLHYQSSTNYPSRNLRDRGRQQHETSKCCEQRLQAWRESDRQRRWHDQQQQRLQVRWESDHEARQWETSGQQQQRLQARRDSDHQVMQRERSVTYLTVWLLAWPVVFAGDEKWVLSDSTKTKSPGENQTMRQGDEKCVINNSKDYKPGDNLIGRRGNMKPLKNESKNCVILWGVNQLVIQGNQP